MKLLIIALMFITGSAFAHNGHYDHDSESNTTSSSLPSQSTYGLLALASNNQFDWGVPDKLQVGVTMAFTEGGNQAVAIGAATRFGGVLLHGNFVTTIDGPDSADSYVVVIGGTMRF